MVPHLHHMILYECKGDGGAGQRYLDDWTSHVGAQCYDANMPDSWQLCNSPIAAWAIGSEGRESCHSLAPGYMLVRSLYIYIYIYI